MTVNHIFSHISHTNRLNKIYDKLTSSIQQKGFFVRTLFNWGMQAKENRMKMGLDPYHWFYDPIVFEKVYNTKGK